MPQSIDLNLGTQPQFQLPGNWRQLSPAAQDAWLDDLSRQRLPAGHDVIDVLGDDDDDGEELTEDDEEDEHG